MVYNIGHLEFKSKKAAENYTRNILSSIDINVNIDKDNIHFKFFVDLLNNHQRRDYKIGSGIKSFIVVTNALGNGLETRVLRTDDTIESFSWKDCSTSKYKTDRDLLDIALRSAIQFQIQDFKMTTSEMCAGCGKYNKCVVDHKSPTFYELKTDFLLVNPKRVTAFDKDEKTHQEVFKADDKDFEYLWQEYHKKHAILQYLCKECHNEKTKNDIIHIKKLKTDICL